MKRKQIIYEVKVRCSYSASLRFEFNDLRDADTFTFAFINNLKESDPDPEKIEISIVPVLVPEQPEEVEADE